MKFSIDDEDGRVGGWRGWRSDPDELETVVKADLVGGEVVARSVIRLR